MAAYTDDQGVRRKLRRGPDGKLYDKDGKLY
jgi:hypothetical protein